MNEEFIWWPAICHQFKIEFGVDIETRFGGNIANLMYSIHALVDKALASHAPSEAAAQPAKDKMRCKYNPHNVECSRQADYKLIETDTGKEFGCCHEHIKNYRDYNERANREVFVIIELLERLKVIGYLEQLKAQIEHNDH